MAEVLGTGEAARSEEGLAIRAVQPPLSVYQQALRVLEPLEE